MSYLASNQVYVFPAAIDRKEFPNSRALSELNLSTLIRIASEKSSYVVTPEFNSNSKFEFVINGYYVCLHGEENPIVFTEGKPVYAVIFIAKDNPEFPMLCGSDADNKFEGVLFVNQVDNIEYPSSYDHTNCDKMFLQILDEQLNVPLESLQRVSNSTVDGGVWDIKDGEFVEI